MKLKFTHFESLMVAETGKRFNFWFKLNYWLVYRPLLLPRKMLLMPNWTAQKDTTWSKCQLPSSHQNLWTHQLQTQRRRQRRLQEQRLMSWCRLWVNWKPMIPCHHHAVKDQAGVSLTTILSFPSQAVLTHRNALTYLGLFSVFLEQIFFFTF